MKSISNWIVRHWRWLAFFGGVPWVWTLFLICFNPRYMSQLVMGPHLGARLLLAGIALGIQLFSILLVFPFSIKFKSYLATILLRLMAISFAFTGFLLVYFIVTLGPAGFQMMEQNPNMR